MSAPEAAPVSDRFVIERRLGAGGFGSVFVAFDRERNQHVALKRLERLDPTSIYRFKHEFRALADVNHPNLVRLFELFSQSSGWSFSMEWVDGVPFDSWVRGQTVGAGSVSHQTTVPQLSPDVGEATQSGVTVTQPSNGAVVANQDEGFDEGRLRDALQQLAAGVSALHAEGILHRDLKPSNVLVARDGRVVILDFGMVATGVVDSHESIDGATMGTPAYMSPEQARGAALTAASDWYAVGLMLYEVLVGTLPFGGNPAEILTAKVTREVEDPRRLRPDAPPDLSELCAQLLKRDPLARPTGSEVLSALAVKDLPRERRSTPAGAPFIGRGAEHAQLRKAFELTKARQTVVAHVYGASGYGKSTLVRHFLGELSSQSDAVVLTGRCFERESVPFKALDDLIDHLYERLRRMRPMEAAQFMPRHAPALVRLFPTLGRLDFMASVPDRLLPKDAHELRRKAFAALREMFVRVTDTRPLVLFIDDAQWGDADSAALFRDLLAPPDVPPLLLIVGYRGEADDQGELLRTLQSPRAADAAWVAIDVPVGPLPKPQAQALAELLLEGARVEGARVDGAQAKPGLAATIADESEGSPFFITQLARRAGTLRHAAEPLSLQQLVTERVVELPEACREVLDLLSCSERPLSADELVQSTGLGLEEVRGALDRLRDEHLIAASGPRAQASYEVLHDKVRLAVQQALSAERLSHCHARLAATLAAAPDVDPETLAHHFAAAGDFQKAMEWTERAADAAAQGVAFDHCVTLYRQALQWGGGEKLPSIGVKLASALVRAGRGAEAAAVYLEVAAKLGAEDARALRQAAAEQYLRSGHVEKALETFGPLLAEAGLALPRTPNRALVSLLWQRTWLSLRGLGFKEQSDASPRALRRIDFCWSIGTGLAGIDLVRSARYHVLSLRLSLRSGEPYRVARALSMEAIMKGLESTAGVKRADLHAQRAFQIAERIDNPHALGWALAARAVVAWGRTELHECIRLCDEAVSQLRQRSLETFREIGSVEVWFALNGLFLSGQLARLAERAPACAREAEARGDRYTLSTVRAYILPLLWAVRDNPEQARREADAALTVWPAEAWYHQHWAWLRAMCFLDLYEGRPAVVLERTRQHRPTMQRAMQLRIRTLRTELNYLEGRGALGCLKDAPERGPLVELVQQQVARLRREDNRLADVYAASLEAGLRVAHSPEQALSAYASLEQDFSKLQMPMHVAACQWRVAQLRGEAGQAALLQAGRVLSDLGVAAPQRWVDVLLP